MYNAMNKVIQMASGEYLLFLNSGDRLTTIDFLKNVFEEKRKEDLLVGYQCEECDGVLCRLSQIEMSYVSFGTFRNTNFQTRVHL